MDIMRTYTAVSDIASSSVTLKPGEKGQRKNTVILYFYRTIDANDEKGLGNSKYA